METQQDDAGHQTVTGPHNIFCLYQYLLAEAYKNRKKNDIKTSLCELKYGCAHSLLGNKAQ